jgi:probable HAF family extracellular repeat protein
MTALTVIVAVALPGRATAQQHRIAPYPYILIDLGTFGGPQSFLNLPAVPINTQGIALGTADTTIPDSDYPNFNPYMVGFPDSTVAHAFAWHKGPLTDLGALPGNNSSAIFELNAHGVGAGMSENGVIDPFTGWPADNATLWKDGQVVNLGTLPGGYESQALAINDRGQVAGFASNGIPDPFSMGGWGTQARGVVWQNGVIHELGTLGGPDSWAYVQNARGQITGWSYTGVISNATTGVPTQDPFLWQDGHMKDLGTLGGTLSFVNWMNNRGEVVGQSNLAGDQTFDPFLWNGHALQDLGTLGGNYGAALWLNEAEEVAGWATLPGDQTNHAFLWQHGVMTDLGTPPGDAWSAGVSINDGQQVVGNAGTFSNCPTCAHGFLWQHGVMADVNTLIAPSDLYVTEAVYIDNQGEISGIGRLPDGNQHVVLLVPTQLAASEGLTSNAPVPGTSGPVTAVRSAPATCMLEPRWLHHAGPRYHPRTC